VLYTEYQEKVKGRVTNAISIIMDELNGGNREFIGNAILERVQREHRTIQQSFWAAMLVAQIGYSHCEFDLRNKAAVELAREIALMTFVKDRQTLPYY